MIKLIEPESDEVDLSIYKYKDQYIQKIPADMSFLPDYTDEKNNCYNVYDIWNDRPYTWINASNEKESFKHWLETWGSLMDWKKFDEKANMDLNQRQKLKNEEGEHGKRN